MKSMTGNWLSLLWLLYVPVTYASIVQFSFLGRIDEVQNYDDVLWDANELTGTNVRGQVLLDTAAGIYGREETSYYWWDNNDSGPGYLTSRLTFGGHKYQLGSENDYLEDWGWQTNEYLEVTNGPDNDGGAVGDGYRLVDNQSVSDAENDGHFLRSKVLSIYFMDLINDFLAFPSGFSDDLQPNFLQEFTWQDSDLLDAQQSGSGSFRFLQDFDQAGMATNIDSELLFSLRQVKAEIIDAEIPAPGTLGIVGLLLSSWWLHLRRRKQ